MALPMTLRAAALQVSQRCVAAQQIDHISAPVLRQLQRKMTVGAIWDGQLRQRGLHLADLNPHSAGRRRPG